MRIVHILGIGRLPKRPMIDATGGTERVALELARIQAARGHDVTIASMTEQPWSGEWQGVRLLHLKPYFWKQLQFRGRLRELSVHLRLLRELWVGRFDVVHLHEYIRTSFFGGLPRVMHFHNDPLGSTPDDKLAEAAPGYWAKVGTSHTQIAVSEFVARRLRLTHLSAGSTARPANIVVNQSGVDPGMLCPPGRDADRARTRARLGMTDDDVLFLFAGAFRKEKGVDYLADAFSRLSKEHGNACLAIAGGRKLWIDPPSGTKVIDASEEHVREILAPAIEGGRAFLLGTVSPSDIGSYYAAADVFVLPSMFQETFGLVILEAFAAGLPVIANRSGGIPELVHDRQNGLLVDKGDREGLFRAMLELLVDRDFRLRLGAEGVKTATRLSWAGTVDRLDRIYQDALKAPPV